jgi:HK97 gp10 family phage protein
MASSFKISGMDETIALLQKLPAEVASNRGGPVKKALRKGAKVLQVHEIALLKASLDTEASGLLADNIIVSRGKPPASGKGERYLVRVKRKTYPGRNGKPVTTLQTAQLKEWGSEKQQAEPFIVPTVNAKGREAIDVASKSLTEDVRKLWKKHGGSV